MNEEARLVLPEPLVNDAALLDGNEVDERAADSTLRPATAPTDPAAPKSGQGDREHHGGGHGPEATAPLELGTTLLRQFEFPLTLIGGGLPAILVWQLQGRVPFSRAFNETIVPLILAAAISWYVLARLRDHAKARHLSYVLPINFLVFSSVLGVLALLRLPYSASLFSVGASFAILVSFLIAVRSRGLMKPHVIVCRGRASEIELTSSYVPSPALTDLEDLVRSGRRDWAIVADLHYPHASGWERLFAQAALSGVPVYHYRQIAEMQTGQVKISHLSENDLGSLIPNVSFVAIKRLLDVVAALLLLPFCLPAFALIALLIRLDSPGSAFFIQERVGFRGKTFRMIKFRTMRERRVRAGNPADRNEAMTRTDDERITQIGAFLRKTRIDELPQIFNILRGEMSWIGPRPEARSLAEWYEAELPFYSYRHIVRPGVTGWAQVNQGHVTDVSDVLAKLRFDFYYIKNVSLWLDMLVALKTIRVIVTGLGAK
jgi:lipopolysaccharide/colanic/teichoic acid biosynthesis glycosyltransferase